VIHLHNGERRMCGTCRAFGGSLAGSAQPMLHPARGTVHSLGQGVVTRRLIPSPLARHLEQENPGRDRRVNGVATATHRDANHEIGCILQLL